MNLKIKKSVILLFISLFRCSSKEDEHIIKQVKDLKFEARYINKYGLPKFFYDVELFIETKEGTIGKNMRQKTPSNAFYKNHSIEMYNNKSIIDFINALPKDGMCNLLIILYFHDGELELKKFVKYFYRKLEENKIDKVEIMYKCNSCVDYLYGSNNFFVELENGCIVLKKTKLIDDGRILEKTIIPESLILDIMNIFFESYAKIFKNPTQKVLFKKYFFNQRLLSLNIDYFKSTQNMLKMFLSESKTYSERKKNSKSFKSYTSEENPEMTYINACFHLLQDSKIMEDLINFTSCKKNIPRYFYPIKDFFYVKDGVSVHQMKSYIKKLNIQDQIREYGVISAYFNYYLKNTEFGDLISLKEIVKIIVDNQKMVEKINLKVFKKLIHILRRFDGCHSEAFYFDLFHEYKYIS